MITRRIPNQTIRALEVLDLPDPSPETVKEATQHASLGSKESFTELQHPAALDKMLLPASPQLVAGSDKNELKIAEDERTEQVINLQKLKSLKI